MTTKRFAFTLSLLLVLIFSSMIYVRSSLAMDFPEEQFPEDTVGKIFLSAELYDPELLRIKAVSEDMEIPVLGTAFHLQYESDKLAFLRYLPGNFLEKGGDPIYMAKALPDQQKVIFGQTLKHDDEFPVGGGSLAYFDFQILEGEEWEFSFKRGVVSGSDPSRQDIDYILWEDLSVSDFDFDESEDETVEAVAGSSSGGGDVAGSVKSFFSGRYILPGVVLAVGVALFVFLFLAKKNHVGVPYNRQV